MFAETIPTGDVFEQLIASAAAFVLLVTVLAAHVVRLIRRSGMFARR